MDHTDFHCLLSETKVQTLVDQWLDEDNVAFDVGGLVAGGEKQAEAKLFCKQDGLVILAGAPFFEAVFRRVHCSVQWVDSQRDGARLHSPDSRKRLVAVVRGPVAGILRGERPALNCLSRASGVATAVRRVVEEVRRTGWDGRIACTRKTTPGFRLVEKYAVLVGGGDTHRFDLGSSMIMLKDNHISACGGDVSKAVRAAKSFASFATKIEVEARNSAEAFRAAAENVDVVMLDNFLPEDAKDTAKLLKSQYPNLIIEASGGINSENFSQYIVGDIDVISMGCLTQGYSCVDFSLKII